MVMIGRPLFSFILAQHKIYVKLPVANSSPQDFFERQWRTRRQSS